MLVITSPVLSVVFCSHFIADTMGASSSIWRLCSTLWLVGFVAEAEACVSLLLVSASLLSICSLLVAACSGMLFY